MDFEKIKSELKNVFKQKNFTIILAGVLILIFSLIALSVLKPEESKTIKTDAQKSEKTLEEVKMKDQYEQEQNQKLTSILEEMEGVGKVSVMMTFEGGEEKVPAYNSDVQKSITEETDSEGGKRKNEQENGGENIVMSSEGGDNKPFVLQTYKPKVISVFITAEGATNSKIKYSIEKVVADLYNVPQNKVNVYPKSS